MSDSCIEVESVTHRFGRRLALDDLSFNVPTQGIFALLGPNGSGKSTLFRILTTLLRPTAGTCRILQHDVVDQPAECRRHIGVVFQNPSLDETLTVRENMLHQGHLYGLRGTPLRDRVDTLIADFQLQDRTRDKIKILSGGLKRRVELAKALLHRPRVLLLDEPSTGLDPTARRSFFTLLTELRDREHITSLMTTHLMEEADDCDQVAIISQGRLQAIDTPDALKQTVGGDVVSAAADRPVELAAEVSRRFAVEARVVDNRVHIEKQRGHEFVPDLVEAYPGEISSVTVGKPTLEDVFVHLTGHRLTEEEGDE